MIKINATKTKFTSEVKNGGKMNKLTIIDVNECKIYVKDKSWRII